MLNRLRIFPFARPTPAAIEPADEGSLVLSSAGTATASIDLGDELVEKILEDVTSLHGMSERLPVDVHNFGLVCRRWLAVTRRYIDTDRTFQELRLSAINRHLESIAMGLRIAELGLSPPGEPPTDFRGLFDEFDRIRIKLPPDPHDSMLENLKQWSNQLRIRDLDLVVSESAPAPEVATKQFMDRLRAAEKLLEILAMHPDRSGINISMSVCGPAAGAQCSVWHDKFIETLARCEMVQALRIRTFPGLRKLLIRIRQATNLARLDLRGNDITCPRKKRSDVSVTVIVNTIKSCKNLKYVDLRDNPISAKGRILLQDVAKSHSVDLQLDPVLNQETESPAST